ncbi:MAG TPA: hypothetical protein VFY45_14030 [Baekduia sp.]|nr:hypothetical protein [Baekduia sp.]
MYYVYWRRYLDLKSRARSRYAIGATQLLGAQIQAARRERRWSQKSWQAAPDHDAHPQQDREGDLSVAIGTVFEIALLVGVPLFHEDPVRLALDRDRTTARSALLPQRVRASRQEIIEDF